MNHVLEVAQEADGSWHAECRACGYGTWGATEEEATRNGMEGECVPEVKSEAAPHVEDSSYQDQGTSAEEHQTEVDPHEETEVHQPEE